MVKNKGGAYSALVVIVALIIVAFLIWYFVYLPHQAEMTAMEISPDGKLMAVGYNTGLIKIWTLYPELKSDWSSEGKLRAQDDKITSLSFDSTGTRLVSASESGKIVMWPVNHRYNDDWSAWKVVDVGQKAYVSFMPRAPRAIDNEKLYKLGVRFDNKFKTGTLREVYVPNLGWILKVDLDIPSK